MKKQYMKPATAIVSAVEPLLSVISGNGIGSGDVDRDGSLDPGSRGYHNKLWDDDEEDIW